MLKYLKKTLGRIRYIYYCYTKDKHILDKKSIYDNPDEYQEIKCKGCGYKFTYNPMYDFTKDNKQIGAIVDEYSVVYGSLIIH